MALVSEIIKDAFREANLIPITQSPTLDEQEEALRLLNRFVRSIFGNEAGDKLQSFAVGQLDVVTTAQPPIFDFTTPYYVPLNARLMVNISAATQINLHPNPEDGSRVAVVDVAGNFNTFNLTLRGNGRGVDGATTAVLNTASLKKEWFYRADLGSWISISDLTITDMLPFPSEFEDLFVLGLAFRLNPRNGASIDPQSFKSYERMLKQFRARYLQTIPQDSEEGLIRLLGTRYYRANYFTKG